MILWLLFVTIFAYFFYTRIWKVYTKIYYYKKQGVPFHGGIFPVFGSYIGLIKSLRKQDLKTGTGSALIDFVQESYF